MKKWATKVIAMDPRNGEFCEWVGPDIEAPSMELAEQYCQENGLGYCKVEGELLASMPCKKDGSPDFSKRIDLKLSDKN